MVTVSDIFEGEDHVFIAMEHMSGGSLLSDLLHLNGKFMDEDFVRAIAYQLLLALENLHYKNFIHGNIKPANILKVSNDEHDHRVKLADFGVSNIVTDCGNERLKLPQFCPRNGKASKYDISSLGVTINLW
jgi:serine/threonine protein kinase